MTCQLGGDVETPDSVMQVSEEEMMEIDKLVILTPGNQLPDLFRKQVHTLSHQRFNFIYMIVRLLKKFLLLIIIMIKSACYKKVSSSGTNHIIDSIKY